MKTGQKSTLKGFSVQMTLTLYGNMLKRFAYVNDLGKLYWPTATLRRQQTVHPTAMWVKKDGVILTSRPYASVVYRQYREVVCQECLLPLPSSPAAPGCRECGLALYCCRGCREAAAPLHSLECGLDCGEEALDSLDPTARLLLRVWLRWSAERRGDWGPCREGEEGEPVPGRRDPRRFSDFLSHEEDIRRDDKKMTHIAEHFRELEEVLLEDMPDFQEFVQLYGMVVINDFELTQSRGRLEGESLGMAVYLAPSIVDHSCRPNAEVEFVGSRLVMRSLVDRQDRDIGAVSFSYVGEDSGGRRDYLRKYFFFDCRCEQCLEELE